MKQGDMTICDYEQKFIQMERFTPTMCPIEKTRVSKFIWVFGFALKDRVVSQRLQTLSQAMEIACLFEQVLNE